MAQLIIFLYRLLGVIFVWPLALFLRNHPNFKGTFAQRFGLLLPVVPSGKKALWIHAASVGEVKAVAGLVKAIREARPDLFITMSCISSRSAPIPSAPNIAEIFPRVNAPLNPRVLMSMRDPGTALSAPAHAATTLGVIFRIELNDPKVMCSPCHRSWLCMIGAPASDGALTSGANSGAL